MQRATAVLLNKQAASSALVLSYLPWLIAASPNHALNVLKVMLCTNICIHVTSETAAHLDLSCCVQDATWLLGCVMRPADVGCSGMKADEALKLTSFSRY